MELEDGREIGTGGMYGFLTVLLRAHGRYGGRTMVAWEGVRANNFRLKLFPSYKRKDEEPTEEHKELVEEMAEQERRLMSLLRLLGIPQYEADGGEADDVIGTLATKASARGLRVGIYSGDGDLRQLVGENVFTISPDYKMRADKVYTTADDVLVKDLVPPALIPDAKALAGDSSDNIPGLMGVGPATAAKALKLCGTVEKLIKAAQAGEPIGAPERFREQIAKSEAVLTLYKKLTTIDTDAVLKSIPPKRDPKRLRNHFMAYKFRSLIDPVEWMGLMRLCGERETEEAR